MEIASLGTFIGNVREDAVAGDRARWVDGVVGSGGVG